MSDVQSRPAAARGTRGSAARGGRGGFSSRGARNASRSATNGDAKHDQETTSLPTLDDQGEIADLKKAYGSKIDTVKAIFLDWSEVDILYALKETDGDEASTVERIIDGSISQWGEVSSQKKDRSKAKAKDTFTTTTGADVPSNNNRVARGGRPDAARGRGRATERGGRGAARGRSTAAPTNGARPKETQPLSVPTEESNAWNTTKNNDDGGWASAAAATSWEPAATISDPVAPPQTQAAPASPVQPATSATIPQGTSKTWASMLRQSVPVPKPAPQPAKEPAAPQPEPVLDTLPAAAETTSAPPPEVEPEPIAELSAEPQTDDIPVDDATVVVSEVALPPSSDQLTKTNLEQVDDVSQPPVTGTAASEAADSWDPRAAPGSATATPISASQAQHQTAHKVPASGFAASAIKATERAPVPRGPAHPQRRFLDQQEAVRMPGAVNQQLERATVQFGAFNLNGTVEEDIDGDREEPETRAQPPADSPVIQPRASLPPAPQPAPDAYTPQKPVSSLPPGAAPTGPQVPPTAPAAQQPAAQVAPLQAPTHPAAQQYNRYGQPASEQAALPQKPFDSYNQSSQPAAAQSHFDSFPGQQQAQTQTQQPGGPYSSAADQYSNYYTADQQGRAQYNYYGGQQNYSQQQQAGQGQEAGLTSRAAFGGYGAGQTDLSSQYPQSANQSRFGAAATHDPSSGPSTPVPQATQGPPASQAHAAQHGGQFYQQQPYYQQYSQSYTGGYPNAYASYGAGGFGTGYGGKAGGTYGQPHYQQQQPYDHTSTAAASGYPQSSLHRADAGAAAGLGDYSRTSAQPGAQPGLGGAGFGGIHDSFTRGSSYGAQAGQSFNNASTQPGTSDDLKPFGDGKTAGPSPAMGAGARPGSATNTGPSQGGLPPPQSQQGIGAYGGFPGHLQSHGLHGAQSGSAGYGMGAGSAQGQQNTPYSGYNSGFGSGNNYYNAQQHQPRGWGGNYGGGNNGTY